MRTFITEFYYNGSVYWGPDIKAKSKQKAKEKLKEQYGQSRGINIIGWKARS